MMSLIYPGANRLDLFADALADALNRREARPHPAGARWSVLFSGLKCCILFDRDGNAVVTLHRAAPGEPVRVGCVVDGADGARSWRVLDTADGVALAVAFVAQFAPPTQEEVLS